MFEETCNYCDESFESTDEQTAYQKRRLHEIDAHDDHPAE